MPHQPDLFASDADAASKSPALTALKFSDAQLSPAQKRFNQLLKQSETLAQRIEEARRLTDQYRQDWQRSMAPLEQERDALMAQMVRWLDQRLKGKGLSAKQRRIARDILCHCAAPLASNGDAQMQALYEAHSDPAPDEPPPGELSDLHEILEGVFGHKLDADPASYDSMEDLVRAHMARMQAQSQERQQAREQRRAARKKTPAQLQAQAQAQAQAQDAEGALRTLFRQLVSALHPDREPDPAEQSRKTALMKEANTAYERRDLLALLRLQLQAELVDEAQIAHLAQGKLSALSALLKERVGVLQRELHVIESRARQEFGWRATVVFSAAGLKRQLHQAQAELRRNIAMMQEDLHLVQDDKRFKTWLREQDDAMNELMVFPGFL